MKNSDPVLTDKSVSDLAASCTCGIALGLAQHLKTLPSAEEVAETLVLRFLNRFEARSCMIMMTNSDGSLSASGSFGVSPVLRSALVRLSFWDPLHLAEVVRTEKVIVSATAESGRTQFPHAENTGWGALPFIAFPLMGPSRCIGAVAVDFARPLEGDEPIKQLALALADILTLYFLVVNQRDRAVNSEEPAAVRQPRNNSDRRSLTESASELTPRQKTVLLLMSRGMSNTQIAFRVGYSESTVRHETMAIFNHFGVAGRHEAVEIAKVQGLLTRADLEQEL